ncbi:lytic transglycosylase domain-containing protein [Roseomonas nepalensis]|uniref:Lytic transglycosylase domain-containing protein n=1 Tax=Muricoccus nepalensis TaxID=1854500 RepID=A0A502GB30_9PROT|nr:lytic transglycosylase domain-containing protein [Roseomonas nepalensis]TPG59044.1 lytic transglycosylase domain-containing protein [Roseomonas nepalensis]
MTIRDAAGDLRRMRPSVRALLGAALALLLAPAAPARAQDGGDWSACRAAIAAVEPGSGLPPGLLGAIALVEAGRASPSGRPEPWPWSWNAEGEGGTAPSKAAAVAAVAALQARGVRSIDVGCLQVNLLHHPDAFPGLEAAFDPATNARYAARFLNRLRAGSPDWGEAIGRYHSGEPERGAAYSRRVALARLGAAWGRGGAVPLPMMRGLAGLCAPGLQPALLIGGAAEARRFLRPGAGRQPPLPRNPRPRMACLRR